MFNILDHFVPNIMKNILVRIHNLNENSNDDIFMQECNLLCGYLKKIL